MGTVDSHIARRKHQTTKMPGGKSTTNSGTNSGGNNYRAYSDGGYAYSNKGSSGNTTSTYYVSTFLGNHRTYFFFTVRTVIEVQGWWANLLLLLGRTLIL